MIYLNNLDYWIVDALRYDPHPTHAHLDLTLEWIKKLNTKRGILTNLHIDLDYNDLKETLPNHIEPAFDNLTFEVYIIDILFIHNIYYAHNYD